MFILAEQCQQTLIIAFWLAILNGFSDFDNCTRGVSCLVSHSLDVTCSLVLTDLAERLCMLDVNIKEKVFRVIGVYAPNDYRKCEAAFQQINQFLISSKQVVFRLGQHP